MMFMVVDMMFVVVDILFVVVDVEVGGRSSDKQVHRVHSCPAVVWCKTAHGPFYALI